MNKFKYALIAIGIFTLLTFIFWSKIEFRIIKHFFFFPELKKIEPKNVTQVYIPLNERIWVHAVNSVEKMKKVSGMSVGFETDVMFDTVKQYFDVSHYPEQAQSGLSYDSLLNSITNHKAYWFWIDFKNLKSLSKPQQQIALVKLKAILLKYSIMDKAIVESENPYNLTAFTDSGFITSYWLPFLNPYFRPKSKIIKWYNEVSDKVSNTNFTVISGPSHLLPLVRRYLPDFQFLMWEVNQNNLVYLVDVDLNSPHD